MTIEPGTYLVEIPTAGVVLSTVTITEPTDELGLYRAAEEQLEPDAQHTWVTYRRLVDGAYCPVEHQNFRFEKGEP